MAYFDQFLMLYKGVVLANFHWHKCDGPPWTYS